MKEQIKNIINQMYKDGLINEEVDDKIIAHLHDVLILMNTSR